MQQMDNVAGLRCTGPRTHPAVLGGITGAPNGCTYGWVDTFYVVYPGRCE